MGLHKEFLKKSLSDQISYLYEHGTFVTDIRYYQYKVNLYLLFGEYYEVFIENKEIMIAGIYALDYKCSRLNFYLDQIRLEGIA